MNAFSIIQSAVFVQTNVKTHPHKPALNNILIYTFDSYIYFLKNGLKFKLWELFIIYIIYILFIYFILHNEIKV